MSLEDSMKELAASNLKLAASLDNYAATIDKYGLKIASDNGDAAKAPAADTGKAATTGKGKGKGKAEAPPADDGFGGDDGFGDDPDPEVPDKITPDMMKAKVLEVRNAYGSADVARALVKEVCGAEAIPDIKKDDYAKVWAACDKKIAEKK